MRSRHFSRRPDHQLFVLLATFGYRHEVVQMALDESAIPAHWYGHYYRVSSNAAKGFFALTSHLERDLLLFFDT